MTLDELKEAIISHLQDYVWDDSDLCTPDRKLHKEGCEIMEREIRACGTFETLICYLKAEVVSEEDISPPTRTVSRKGFVMQDIYLIDDDAARQDGQMTKEEADEVTYIYIEKGTPVEYIAELNEWQNDGEQTIDSRFVKPVEDLR